MIRTLAIIAGAGLALSIVGIGGAAALGGGDIRSGNWSGASWNWDVDNGGWGRWDDDSRAVAGPLAQRTLDWTGGDLLAVDVPVDVVFVQGEPASVLAEGRQDVLDSLTLDAGRLAFAEGTTWRRLRDSDLRITVTAPDVTRFELRGSGDLSIRGYDQPSLAVAVAGSGDIDAAGRTDKVEANVSGSGELDLRYLQAVDAQAAVAGSGDIDLAASGTVSASVAGSGDIQLHGRPASLSSQVSGSGNIRVDD